MVAFKIFGFSVYRYGIFYLVAFLLGYFGLAWIGRKKWFARVPNVQYFLTEGLENLLVAVLLGVMIGGRLGHVLIYGNGYYFSHPIEIFKVREGGMSFIGGIFGVVTSVGIYLRRKKLSLKEFFILMDLLLIFVPLGIFFGRIGNFLNQELYGIPIAQLPMWFGNLLTSLGFAHYYTNIDQVLRVNTNFLSMLFEGMLVFFSQILLFSQMLKKKKFKIGVLSSNFLLCYSIIRFLLEYVRADSQLEFVGLFTKSQRFFLGFIILAIILMWRFSKEKPLTLDHK